MSSTTKLYYKITRTYIFIIIIKRNFNFSLNSRQWLKFKYVLQQYYYRNEIKIMKRIRYLYITLYII